MLHVPLPEAKVLHVRAKTSTLADFTKLVLPAARVDLMTLFPSHAYISPRRIRVPRTRSCLGHKDFSIPFDDRSSFTYRSSFT